MKTQQDLAKDRLTVKKAIRKQLHKITGSMITEHIIPTKELYADDHLFENLDRIRFAHNRTAECFNYNSDLSTRHYIMRDYVMQIMEWLETEGKQYENLWNLQSDIKTGRVKG